MNRHLLVRRAVGALVGGALAGALVGYPSLASAWWVRQHPADCVGLQNTMGSNVDFRYVDFGAGANGTYICPVPDDSSMPKTAIVTSNIEAWQGGSQMVQAKPCFADWDGQIGQCDSASMVSGTGHKTIALGSGNGFWDTGSGSDFGFIHIVTSGSTGRIAGIFYTN